MSRLAVCDVLTWPGGGVSIVIIKLLVNYSCYNVQTSMSSRLNVLNKLNFVRQVLMFD